MQRHEVTRKGLLTGGAAAGAAVLAGAAPAGAQAQNADETGVIVGSWLCTIVAVDPPLGQFQGLQSFHRGGIVTEARRYYVPATPLGPLLETSGHGAWRRTGGRSFTAFFRFLLQQAPPSAGAPLGTDNIRLNVEVDRSGDAFAGTFASTILDTGDATVFAATGTITATRITA